MAPGQPVPTVTTSPSTSSVFDLARAQTLLSTVFDEERGELQKELDAANATLARMREEHKEAEAGLYKSKKREQQDVESVINEYDADLGSKDEEYQAVSTAHGNRLHV
eukprot:353268-Chlamydomonas_euryale.AAC.9